jgi:hypothetical protein
MTTDTNTEVCRGILAFRTPKPLAGRRPHTEVALWIEPIRMPGAPDFTGRIGQELVSLNIRKVDNHAFMSVCRSIQCSLNPSLSSITANERIGTATFRVTNKGKPALAIQLDSMHEQTIWADVTPEVPLPLLAHAGLDRQILSEKMSAAGLT